MDDPNRVLNDLFEYNKGYEEEMATFEHIECLKKNNYMDSDGQPLKCWYCENDFLKEVVTDKIDYIVVEKDKICSNEECGELLGSWTYGSWQEYV